MSNTAPGRRLDVDGLVGLPRVCGLAISSDGARVVVQGSSPDEKGQRYMSALYELDPRDERAPQRLTRSRAGESGARFAPDGSLLFTSARPKLGSEPDEPGADRPALWRLPAGGGEAHLLANPPGGVGSFAVASESGDVVFAAGMYPGAGGWEQDARREKEREQAGVEAQLFEEYPVRFWDHYLGPREQHLFLARLSRGEGSQDDGPIPERGDLTPCPGRALDEAEFDLTPDGATVVTTRWREDEASRQRLTELVTIDTATKEERILANDAASYSSPACSPDGCYVAALRSEISSPERLADVELWILDLRNGEGRELLEGFDRWPGELVWSPDGEALFFTADEAGETPVFRAALEGGVEKLAGGGAFTDPCPTPRGPIYALRSAVDEPPRPVTIPARASGGTGAKPQKLGCFGALEDLELSARVERVTAEAPDGTPVGSWLLLPAGASAADPAPLAAFIHGGPMASWSGWNWRWNPHPFVEAGWAVLLPDPALSTGYGLEFLRRGWGRWGDVVYEDLVAAVDAVVEREDVDADRTVAVGGSFGGYMTNWIAGHTDRFEAIVSHASVWDLESDHGESDLGWFWEQEFGDPYTDPSLYREHSPRPHVADIKTPMLVIHGELDYRVNVSQALTLWTDLKRNGVQAKFLHFPDENHRILKPNNIRLWYRTVLAFIDHYARGRSWERPYLV